MLWPCRYVDFRTKNFFQSDHKRTTERQIMSADFLTFQD